MKFFNLKPKKKNKINKTSCCRTSSVWNINQKDENVNSVILAKTNMLCSLNHIWNILLHSDNSDRSR